VDPVPDPLFLRKYGSAWNRTRASGSVARNSDRRTPRKENQTDARKLPSQDISIEKTQTNIHDSSGLRTHDRRHRAGEDIFCLDRAATDRH
jgi:hypothetical protein